MDTMEITKIVGGLCGALLLLLLLNTAGDALYHVGAKGHGDGHGDDHHGEEKLAGYPIEVEMAAAVEEVIEIVEIESFLAEADIASGEGIFKKCQSCHALDPAASKTGPNLLGVVDRDIASVEGYKYSEVLLSLEGAWAPQPLSEFLEDPKGYAPKTKMVFKGLSKPTDRADLIAYLRSASN